MISVTGDELSRASLDDRFRRILASLCAQPLGAARAATKGPLAFVGSVRNAPGLGEELLLVPVVVDVGAIEALDHLGGAGAGFNGLEDAEGDQGTATFVVQAVRVDNEGGPPARGSLPGGLAATLVRALALFRERVIPAHRDVFDQTSFSGRSLRTCLS